MTTTMTTARSPAAGPAAAACRASTPLQALLAAALGVLLLAGAGFAQVEAVHNATHDVRHANGFPCH